MMYHCTVEILHSMDWDSSDVAGDCHVLIESLAESFTDFGQTVKRIFSDHVPAYIDYAVNVSNIYQLNLKCPYEAIWLQRHRYIKRRGRSQRKRIDVQWKAWSAASDCRWLQLRANGRKGCLRLSMLPGEAFHSKMLLYLSCTRTSSCICPAQEQNSKMWSWLIQNSSDSTDRSATFWAKYIIGKNWLWQ